jgi:hypothetical protein
MSRSSGWGVLRRQTVVGIGHAGIAHAHFLAAAERWVAVGSKRRHGGIVVARQIDDVGKAVRGRVNDELTWDGDAVGRARGANDAAALPAVVFPIQEVEAPPTHGTLRDLGIRLPRRQHDVTDPPRWRCIGRLGIRRERRQRS